MNQVAVVIPTLGESSHLARCLEALRLDGGPSLELILVHQGDRPVEIPSRLVDRLERSETNLGFAAGTNLGLAATRRPFVATVNDDVVVEPGWLAGLLHALEEDPRAAAAQGVNLILERPQMVDGCGLAWNRSWQAVQMRHGEEALGSDEPTREIFGVSATAALYRRRALERVATDGGAVFDPRLGSYYEDVDLACRLRGAGYRALLVPQARAHHAGSATGSRKPAERLQWIYGNRYLVLARVLGRSFWPRLPFIVGRDLVDLARAAGRRDSLTLRAILGGWRRAGRLLPRFAHAGPPVYSPMGLRRFR